MSDLHCVPIHAMGPGRTPDPDHGSMVVVAQVDEEANLVHVDSVSAQSALCQRFVDYHIATNRLAHCWLSED